MIVAEAGLKLVPEDEYMHTPDPVLNFNESVYLNGFDARTRSGGWMRLGNRVNEGHAELSVVLYLPDGRTAVSFGRPEISTNDRFEAGGLRYTVATPFKEVAMSYAGEVMILEDPAALRDPKRMFETAERAQASVRFESTGVSPVHGGEPSGPESEHLMYYGPRFSRGHFNQHVRTIGAISVGDISWEIDGFGWRDHSWGPRYWQAIWAYRLFLATFAEDRALMLLKNMYADGTSKRVGVLLVGDEYEEVLDLDLTTEWSAQQDPQRVVLGVRTANRKAVIDAEVKTLAPLRNRRREGDELLVSRVAEGFSEFHWDGHMGCGMVEYIERLHDGRAVGYPL